MDIGASLFRRKRLTSVSLLVIMQSCWIQVLALVPVDSIFFVKEYNRVKKLVEVDEDWRQAVSIAEIELNRSYSRKNSIYRAKWLNIIGDCALEESSYNKALQCYESSIKIAEAVDATLYAESLNKLGNYYIETKAFDRSKSYLDQSLQLWKEIHGDQYYKVAQVYNNLGRYYQGIGDLEAALNYHDQSLAIRMKAFGEPHPEIGQSYLNRGVVWSDMGQLELAIADYQKALHQFGPSDRNTKMADVLFNLGQANYEKSYFENALNFFTHALEIYRLKLKKDHPIIAQCYNNLANIFISSDKGLDKAIHFHEQALSIRKNKFGKIHADVAESQYNLAVAYWFKGDLSESINRLKSCFNSLGYDLNDKNSFTKVTHFNVLISGLQLLSNIRRQDFDSSGEFSVLLESFEYYQTLDKVIDFLRQRYDSQGAKLLLAKNVHFIYDQAIQSAQGLYQITNDILYAKKAFYFSEKSKSLLLLESIKKNNPASYARIDTAYTNEIRGLETRITELDKRRYQESFNYQSVESGLIDSISNIILNQQRRLESKIEKLKIIAPDYYRLMYQNEPPTIQMIQDELLTKNQTIVEYFLGSEHIQIFVISKGRFDHYSIPLPIDFKLWLFTFQSSIRDFAYISSKRLSQNIEIYNNAAYQLYLTLLEPLKEQLNEELIFIPGDELELLPFEALLTEPIESETYNFKNYPFFLKDHVISYNYSTSLMKEMQGGVNTGSLNSYVGFAPNFKGDSLFQLKKLKYNDLEVEAVNDILKGEIWIDQSATKKRFIQQIKNAKIVHLATHGMMNAGEGDYSFLVFTPIEGAPINESFLYVKDIYNLSTNAELVVLSACETAIGEIQRGEGMSSIARSFSYAGAISLVASKWSVDDMATSQLVNAFFERLHQGKPKNHALRDAKLNFIESAKGYQAHPFFWASFVPIGSMKPITANHYGLELIFFIGLAFIFGYILLFWIKMKRMERKLFRR